MGANVNAKIPFNFLARVKSVFKAVSDTVSRLISDPVSEPASELCQNFSAGVETNFRLRLKLKIKPSVKGKKNNSVKKKSRRNPFLFFQASFTSVVGHKPSLDLSLHRSVSNIPVPML